MAWEDLLTTSRNARLERDLTCRERELYLLLNDLQGNEVVLLIKTPVVEEESVPLPGCKPRTQRQGISSCLMAYELKADGQVAQKKDDIIFSRKASLWIFLQTEKIIKLRNQPQDKPTLSQSAEASKMKSTEIYSAEVCCGCWPSQGVKLGRRTMQHEYLTLAEQ